VLHRFRLACLLAVALLGAPAALRAERILLLTSPANPFSAYYAEILRAEGFPQFAMLDLAGLDAAALAECDLVLLGELKPLPAQVKLLADWVAEGGNLIAMRPKAPLGELMGLEVQSPGSSSQRAYFRIDNSQPPGAGICGESMQYHGPAARYAPTTATTVATLYRDANSAIDHPALTINAVGPHGGQAAGFAFDVARSVVLTRQGNPAWSGQERDGTPPIRSDDLFFGAAELDPQPDWVDLDKVAIPQADELQRLLANLIHQLTLDRQPQPRFWYFPKRHKAVVIMTGDHHGCCLATRERFRRYQAQSPAGCSLVDWECVRATSYVYPGQGQAELSDAEARAFDEAGFELAVHVNTECKDWTPASLDAAYSQQLAAFARQFPSLPAPATNRTHCIVWSDCASQPQIALRHGIRLDTNYYYWPPPWVRDVPGVFTGSALPMRFATPDGRTIDCYQVATQMTDESKQTYPLHADTLLDRALGPEGYYGAYCANMHTDSAVHPESDAIVESCRQRGVPVISARQMLTWLDGRERAKFTELDWQDGRLSFRVEAAEGARNLTAMVPTATGAGRLVGLKCGGELVEFGRETIKGVEYALFPAASGHYVATYGAAGE
jgi:hypothetical protein